jgi:hypothetical protein
MSDVLAGFFFFRLLFFFSLHGFEAGGRFGGGCKFGRLIKERGLGARDKWCFFKTDPNCFYFRTGDSVKDPGYESLKWHLDSSCVVFSFS